MKNTLIVLFLLSCNLAFSQAKPLVATHDNFITSSNISSLPVLSGNDSLFGYSISASDFAPLHIAPVVYIMGAQMNKLNYSAFAGVQLEGKISNKFFYSLGVLGGQNSLDPLGDYSYQSWSNAVYYPSRYGNLDLYGKLSYSPNEIFNLQVGMDKFHLGNGERSLILDDYGRVYPYAALRTSIWHFELMNLYQFLKEDVGGRKINKYAAAHYLSYQVTPRFEVSLFETVVFQPKDTTWNRGYELEYLNPLLVLRPSEYGLGSSDNIMIGINLNFQIFKNHLLYSQFVLDDGAVNELVGRTRWWANKYGVQLGLKGKGKLFTKKFDYLIESNLVRPFTYSHLNTLQNYGNLGLPLAHPSGSNFVEVFSKFNYQLSDVFSLNLSTMYMVRGGVYDNDTLSSGTNIYQPYTDRTDDYGYKIGNNGMLKRLRLNLGVTALINRKINMVAFANFIYLNDNTEIESKSTFGVQIGVRTNLWKDRSFTY